MGTSRDANDARDQLRAMNKEARAEFEDEETRDTGGAEHASRAEREGVPAKRRAAGDTGSSRATREQDDADALRVPGGGGAGGAEAETGATAEPRPVKADDR
jgi:hypothetical protein